MGSLVAGSLGPPPMCMPMLATFTLGTGAAADAGADADSGADAGAGSGAIASADAGAGVGAGDGDLLHAKIAKRRRTRIIGADYTRSPCYVTRHAPRRRP